MKIRTAQIWFAFSFAALVGCRGQDNIIPRKDVPKSQAQELGQQMISALVEKKSDKARQLLKDGADPKTASGQVRVL
jgi:hypothetical protein